MGQLVGNALHNNIISKLLSHIFKESIMKTLRHKD